MEPTAAAAKQSQQYNSFNSCFTFTLSEQPLCVVHTLAVFVWYDVLANVDFFMSCLTGPGFGEHAFAIHCGLL